MNKMTNNDLFEEAKSYLWRELFNELILAEIFAVSWIEYTDDQVNDWSLLFLVNYTNFEKEFWYPRSNRMVKDIYYYHVVNDDEKVFAIKAVADNFASILWPRWRFSYDEYLNSFDRLILATYVESDTDIDKINNRMFDLVVKQIEYNRKNDWFGGK